MQFLRCTIDDLPIDLGPTALSIGNFDGVHRGHQQIVGSLVAAATKHHATATVMTFDPPPSVLLRPDRPVKRLTPIDMRCHLLAGAGVKRVIVVAATRRLLELSAEEFFFDVLRQRCGVVAMAEGDNFYFGKDRSGSIETLRRLCEQAAVELIVVPEVKLNGCTVSSSAIRDSLYSGAVDVAATMLGRPYVVTGEVESGAQRGRKLGFPTANLGRIETLLPLEGVYAGMCRLGHQIYSTAIHIGANTTFGETRSTVECHLIGFSGDLYGQQISVAFLKRLRGSRQFASGEDLKRQLFDDCRLTVDAVRQSDYSLY